MTQKVTKNGAHANHLTQHIQSDYTGVGSITEGGKLKNKSR